MQGCLRHCKNCHNVSTWDLMGGYEISIEKLVKEIRRNCLNKKLTITGGEPLLQYDELMKLVNELKEFNICIYTGYEEHEIPESLYKVVDYIKVGHFNEELKSSTIPYIGSSNQKFIKTRSRDEKSNG